MNSATFEHSWPQNVPENLTQPSRSYKKHIILAMAGLLLFIGTYLAMTYWFGHTAYRLFDSAIRGNGGFIEVVVAIFNTFLAVFMVKSLFISNKNDNSGHREITELDEPRLFKFLYDLADKTGAPRPHKVYLSNMVNATVFYDLKFWNLIFPTKKNLEIGLGLINVLNIGEFRAVLAHEFGHFAQRSMLLGKWVYVANQIAGYIVGKRDGFDAFLAGLSRVDLRIAWTGWILSIIVWSIRSIIDMCFRLAVLAHHALSREMEFQADLVAVSVTGSDALIHALHKLRAADQGFTEALGVANELLADKKAVEDIYTLQSNAINQTARIFNNPEYAASPTRPENNRASHRIFQSKIAQPPNMWASHPADNDRENNAKRIYIDSDIVDESSWSLFRDALKTKLELTEMLIASAKMDGAKISSEEALAKQNKTYDRGYLAPKYRGIYLKQPITRHVKKPQEICERISDDMEVIKSKIQQLYPETLEQDLEALADINEELAMLRALEEKILDAPGGVITHRGQQINRKDLPRVIETVKQENHSTRGKVIDHIQLSRSLHQQAAQLMDSEWATYHESLIALTHFAEHSQANISDLFKILNNVLYVVMAGGNELQKLMNAANDLRDALKLVYTLANSERIKPGKEVLEKMEKESWSQALEKFDLPYADEHNINEWMQVIEGWAFGTINQLEALRNAAVETLLETEQEIARALESDQHFGEEAPQKNIVEGKYPLLLLDKERPFEHKLSTWDKFIAAEGTLATIARSAVAILIVGAAVGFGATINPSSKIYIYNGLDLPVEVELNGRQINLEPHSSEHISTEKEDQVEVVASTEDGQLIEKFIGNLENRKYDIVYNVANASALVKWTASYGIGYNNSGNISENPIGNPRWTIARADHFFEEPPKSVKSSRNSRPTRDVLSGFSDIDPTYIFQYISNKRHHRRAIISHAIWDSEDSKHILAWLNLAREIGIADSIIQIRLERKANELVSLRLQQEMADGDEKKKVCASQKELSESQPDNPDLYYLKCRCMTADEKRFAAILEGVTKWPDHDWITYSSAYEYAKRGDWTKALDTYEKLSQSSALQSTSEIEIARIKRLVTNGLGSQPNNANEYLQFVNMIEDGQDPSLANSPYQVFHFINEGDLKSALRHTSSYSTLWFIGASDGASDSIIDVVMQTPPDSGLDQNSIWTAIGLQLRFEKDVTRYYAQLNEYTPDFGDSVSLFLEEIKHGDFESAQVFLDKTSPWLKGQMCTAAVVAYGTRVPLYWRENAKLLLFCIERPYFE